VPEVQPRARRPVPAAPDRPPTTWLPQPCSPSDMAGATTQLGPGTGGAWGLRPGGCLVGARGGPDVDAGLDGVAVDRGQFVVGEAGVAGRGEVLLELRDAA